MTTKPAILIALIACLTCSVCATNARALESGGTDKTLVSWVRLDNLDQRGGSVLTIQSGDQFDGIVFGELQPRKWMPGSDLFKRTQEEQSEYLAETIDNNTVVQMAISYKGDEIRAYRNGRIYASYNRTNIDLLTAENRLAVFGLRHVGPAGGDRISGAIEDARIYDIALTIDQIRSLQPNEKGEVQPYAWWDFEGDTVTDHMGQFAHSKLIGEAKLDDGRLVLARDSALVAAGTEENIRQAARGQVPRPPYVAETPRMPDQVPENWLTYHLAHPGPGVGMPGDPNCAFFYKGLYHLHYIYKHNHGFAFAHVSSRDMVKWKWHPTVLVGPNTGHGMFSGTGFFTKNGTPAIIYHGEGSGRNQIAVSTDDRLEKWSQPKKLEPKIREGQDATKIAHWDPDAWIDGDHYYALSGGSPGSGKPPTLFRSNDLKNWDYLGLFLTNDAPDVQKDEDISCPNFFKLGKKHMLLCISHTLGCRYYLGEWKDEKFTPDFHARMNWNKWDFFAPESLLAPDGRRIMWSWCNLPGAQSAIQSLPRELSLPDDGVLRIKPLRELKKLRHDEQEERKVVVKGGNSHRLQTSGDTLELSVTINPTNASEYGVKVFCDANGNGFPIAIKPSDKSVTVGSVHVPFELKEGEPLQLRIFLDKGMIEVFLNERQAAVNMKQHAAENTGVCIFSEGSDITADVKSWQMHSAYSTTD